jgi:hypothetical protein
MESMSMRLGAVAALAFALAACGGGDGGELAAGNSQLSQAQIDAALGPADQAGVEDAIVPADNAAGNSELDGVTGE